MVTIFNTETSDAGAGNGSIPVGDIIKDAVVKGYSSFGCFFEVNNEIDVLVHLQEISY